MAQTAQWSWSAFTWQAASASVDTGSKLSPANALLLFFVFFAVLLVVALVKKAYYYFRFKKRYYVFPRPSIYGIANIAMVTALSVAILLLLTVITSNLFAALFRAFPGSRITIEGILIKVGGLLFGPFLGMIIGAITDLLSVLMTAGVFHYGYFIAAMGYGLLSGFVKTIFSYSKQKNLSFAIFSTVSVIVINALAILFFTLFIGEDTVLMQAIIPSFIIPSAIPRAAVIYIILGFACLVLTVIWGLFFFSKKLQARKYLWKTQQKKLLHNKPKKINRNYYVHFCLILVTIMTSELLINVLIMPSFDADLSTLDYDNWFLIRIVFFIPLVIFNFAVIYPVYTIVWPLVKWDYKKELVEDINIPLYYK